MLMVSKRFHVLLCSLQLLHGDRRLRVLKDLLGRIPRLINLPRQTLNLHTHLGFCTSRTCLGVLRTFRWCAWCSTAF